MPGSRGSCKVVMFCGWVGCINRCQYLQIWIGQANGLPLKVQQRSCRLEWTEQGAVLFLARQLPKRK